VGTEHPLTLVGNRCPNNKFSPGRSVTGFHNHCKTELAADENTACSHTRNDGLRVTITRKTNNLHIIIVRKHDDDNLLIGFSNAVSPTETTICGDYSSLKYRTSHPTTSNIPTFVRQEPQNAENSITPAGLDMAGGKGTVTSCKLFGRAAAARVFRSRNSGTKPPHAVRHHVGQPFCPGRHGHSLTDAPLPSSLNGPSTRPCARAIWRQDRRMSGWSVKIPSTPASLTSQLNIVAGSAA